MRQVHPVPLSGRRWGPRLRRRAVAHTGGFHQGLGESGLIALAAVPVTFLLVRRAEIARAVAATQQRPTTTPTTAD